MPTDYDLPVNWHDLTDEKKSRWYTQERCRRQAMRQRTGYAQHMAEKAERDARKRAASPAHVKLDEYR